MRKIVGTLHRAPCVVGESVQTSSAQTHQMVRIRLSGRSVALQAEVSYIFQTNHAGDLHLVSGIVLVHYARRAGLPKRSGPVVAIQRA